MSDKQQSDRLDLPAIAAILRRRAALILLCVAVAASVAVGLALRQDKQYTAAASLLFRDPSFDSALFGTQFASPYQDPVRLLKTNLQLVSLPVVSQKTAQRLGGPLTGSEISGKVGVSVEGDSDLASVTVTDTDPARAAAIANAFASEYIKFRRDSDRAKIREAQVLVRRQLSLDNSGDRRRALEKREEDLQILASLQTGNAELVERAVAPGAPSSPKPRRSGLIGGFLGLLLGLALALGVEQLDRRIKRSDELEEEFGLPVLASVPKSRSLASAGQNGGGTPSLPPLEGEAFRMLRANIRYFNLDREIRSVLVTSAAPKDGKSTVALNLAIAAAETGTDTLLLEADLRAPSLANFLGVSADNGLTSLLTDRSLQLSDVGWRIPIGQPMNGAEPNAAAASLDVVFAGPVPPNPTELLEAERMRMVIQEAERRYSLVVIDTPPITAVSDAIPLLSQVSGVLVVSRLGGNSRALIRRLSTQLRNFSAPTLGIVANFTTDDDRQHYGYGYGDQPGKAARPRALRITR